jgi:diguanylate cyclase (GGDEF)-like protein
VGEAEEEALRRENAALRQAISLLHRIANLSRASLELEPTIYAILTGVTAGVGLGLNRAMMFLVEPGESGALRLRGAAAIGPIDEDEAHRVWTSIEAEQPDLQTLYEEGLLRRADPGALDRRVRTVEIGIDDDTCIASAWAQQRLVKCDGHAESISLVDPTTGIASPMRGRTGVHGVLYADNRFTGEAIDAVTAMVFSLVADHAGRAIENARRYEDVARAARTDALTGLGHHGALMEAMHAAVRDATRLREPLSIAMIDIDDFKQVNDTFGHPTGDRVLSGVAARLRATARAGAIYRYGGEEFTVLLPGADTDAAFAAAERLREAVASAPIETHQGSSIGVTLSIGVATLRAGMTPDHLLQHADDALLEAKAGGKNQVVAAARSNAPRSKE